MASPFELRHGHARLFAALMLAGACSLLGLNLIHALHHAVGHHCEADAGGDPFDCFLCKALSRMAPAPAVVFIAPPAEPGEILIASVLVIRPESGIQRPRPARAPPPSIL
jgi:hypothetical protein